jgi:hypothetical protein
LQKRRSQQERIRQLERLYSADFQDTLSQKSISISDDESFSFSEENIELWSNENEILVYLLSEMKMLD